MSWNGYPRRLTRKLISLFSPSTTTDNLNMENVNADNKTTDAAFFVSLKNPTPKHYKSSIVYEFKRPGCNANYIGKTNRCLYTRIKEYSSHNTSEVYNHVAILLAMNLTTSKTIFTDTKIIDKATHWSLLLLYI